jgi:hypothetical protein
MGLKATYAGPAEVDSRYELPASLLFPSVLHVRAEQRALRKVKQQNVNLAVAFGERAAVAEQLAKTAKNLHSALKAARHLDFRNMARHLSCAVLESGTQKELKRLARRGHDDKVLANVWLAHQYGWQPLYGDIYGSFTELMDRDKRFEDRYTCHTTAKTQDYTDEFVRDMTFQPFSTNLIGTGWMRTRIRNRCYVRLDYVLENPMLATAAEIGLTNPLEVAWELVPFSFVADWFIPLGTYLSSLDATVGWSFKGGSASRITRAHREFGVSTIRYDSGYAVNQRPSNGSPVSHQKHMQFSRSVYGSSPQPWLPSLTEGKGISSAKRAISAIALLRSFFG